MNTTTSATKLQKEWITQGSRNIPSTEISISKAKHNPVAAMPLHRLYSEWRAPNLLGAPNPSIYILVREGKKSQLNEYMMITNFKPVNNNSES